MAVVNVKRWVWIVIGMAVGAGFHQAQRMTGGSWKEEYGEQINQREFEDAMAGGRGLRRLKDLVVYRDEVADLDGKGKALYIVVGEYWGHAGKWERRSFISEMPYRPLRTSRAGIQTTDSVEI